MQELLHKVNEISYYQKNKTILQLEMNHTRNIPGSNTGVGPRLAFKTKYIIAASNSYVHKFHDYVF